MIISDLEQGIINKLRGRDDRLPFIPGYVKKVLLDFSQNYEFEELKVTGPLTNFIQGQSEYPLQGGDINGIKGNPFIYSNDVRLTFIKSWFIYYGTTVTSGQTTGTEIKQRNLRVVEPMSKILGLPTVCCIYGKEQKGGKLIVGFMPDQGYACQMRYQRQHPFPIDGSNLSALRAQEIYMPLDWQDLIEIGAAEKACYDIGMVDVGIQYHQLLYGNPSQRYPGLIAERFSRQEDMKSENEAQLKPVVRKY